MITNPEEKYKVLKLNFEMFNTDIFKLYKEFKTVSFLGYSEDWITEYENDGIRFCIYDKVTERIKTYAWSESEAKTVKHYSEPTHYFLLDLL